MKCCAESFCVKILKLDRKSSRVVDGERAAVTQRRRLRPRQGSQSPPLPLRNVDVSPQLCFDRCFRPTIGLHSQQPKQTFVNLYAPGHIKGGWGGVVPPLPSSLPTPLRNSNPARGYERRRAPPAESGVTCDYHYL